MNNLFKEKKQSFSIFFVGIGGISMSSLALYLKKSGFLVSGYDCKISKITCELERCGIEINNLNNLNSCDIAVTSSAINENDQIIKKLKSLNKPIISRARLLYEIASAYPFTVGVAGTHGKTTCTSMLAHIFNSANLQFCAHIGGVDKTFSNLAYFGEDIFLSEVCEYKKNINLFSPTIGVLLNVADDHLESYGRFSLLEEAFSNYLNRSKIKVVLYEQIKYASENAITFSLNNELANYFASEISVCKNHIEFVVNQPIGALFAVKLNTLQTHDILNALASVAVAKQMGIDNADIKSGLENFNGVKRRNEIMATVNNTLVFADYAHHPDQIKDAVELLKSKYKKYAVFFQSHTYSRTSDLFNKFKSVLSSVENLFIFDTYGARENYDYRGSGKRLSENIKGCVYCGAVSNAGEIFKGLVGKFECIAVIGAGDLYDVIEETLEKDF